MADVEGPVLVTGATGFLGGRLVRMLHSNGVPCIALGRNPQACAELRALGIPVIEHDLTRPLRAFGPVGAIVHCAALSAAFGARRDFVAANVTATERLADFAANCAVERVVHVSSPTVYFAMRDQLDVREDMTLPRPINAYANTKKQGEDIMLGARGFRCIVLRPRGIYGPGDTTLLPSLLQAAARGPLPLLRDGRAQIDLTYVDDVIGAIHAALRAPSDAYGQIYNVSGGEVIPIRDIVDTVCRMAGVPVRWRPTPFKTALVAAQAMEWASHILPSRAPPVVTRYTLGLFAFAQSLDVSKAKAHLGWKPETDFATGLHRTFAKRRDGFGA